MLFALVANANGTEVRLTRVAAPDARTTAATGWEAANIHEAVRALAARGVTFERYDGLDQDADGVWRGPDGTMIAWFDGPAGNPPGHVPGA